MTVATNAISVGNSTDAGSGAGATAAAARDLDKACIGVDLAREVLRTAGMLTNKVAILPDWRRIQPPHVTSKSRRRVAHQTKRAARQGRLPVVVLFVPAV